MAGKTLKLKIIPLKWEKAVKKIFYKLPLESEFVNNAFKLTIGTGLAQTIPMLFYPILGRIFTPLEFGVLGIITSITAILTALASGNYEYSILIAATKKNAINIIGLVILISFSFLLISSIIFHLFSGHIEAIFKEPGVKKWLFICPICAFMITIYNCYNEFCVRNKFFVEISFNKITNSTSTTLGKLFFGLLKFPGNGLVIGDLTGRIISAGACIFRFLKKERNSLILISFKRMRHLIRRYIEFPKLGLPAELLNTIGVSIPVLLIGAYSNSTEVGYYAMTMNVISIPIGILSASIKDVFRQRANEEYLRTGNCADIFKRLLKVLVIWVFIGSLILFFILPDVFSVVLGRQWQVAGEYSQILLPMISLSFICFSLSGVFVITEKMNISLYWQIYYVVITIFSIFFGFKIFHHIKAVLFCFAIGRSSAYLLNIFLSYWYSRGNKINDSKE